MPDFLYCPECGRELRECSGIEKVDGKRVILLHEGQLYCSEDCLRAVLKRKGLYHEGTIKL